MKLYLISHDTPDALALVRAETGDKALSLCRKAYPALDKSKYAFTYIGNSTHPNPTAEIMLSIKDVTQDKVEDTKEHEENTG